MDKNIIFEEITYHLINDEKPSLYVEDMVLTKKYNTLLTKELYKLQNIEQNPKYHPEGNVLNHVLMVIDNASKFKVDSSDKAVYMWSALLHDIGKTTTTKVRKGRITSYNHDIEGEKSVVNILKELTNDEEFIYKVSKLVRHHMQPLYFDKNLSFFTSNELVKDTNYEEVALLSTSDRLGRGGVDDEIKELELSKIEKFKKYFRNL